MKTHVLKLFSASLVGLCLAAGTVWGACVGDSEVAGEWIFEPVAEWSGWALNSGGDGDMGNLGLTGGAAFSTNVPPVNCDCGHSLFLPGANGVAGAVSINDYDPLAGAEKFSILAWVRRDSVDGANLSARVFSDTDSTALINTTSGVEFRFSGNAGNLALRINGTEVSSTVGGISPTNGEWHHVAVVYDGTRAATSYATRNVHFYVDGIQRGVGSTLKNVTVETNYAPVVVGNASPSRTAANLLAGNVDDVLVVPGWAPAAVGNGNASAAIQCFMNSPDDIFPPTIVAPPDVEAEAGECLAPVAVVLGTPTTTDDCGVALVTNNAPELFDVGLTDVTWSAVDRGGNIATATQTVAVVPSRTGDCDHDGLTDYVEERELGTDSTRWDTDGDGWGDGAEVENVPGNPQGSIALIQHAWLACLLENGFGFHGHSGVLCKIYLDEPNASEGLVDASEEEFPFYSIQSFSTTAITGEDTPELRVHFPDVWPWSVGMTSQIDVRFQFRLSAVWRFPDGTIYFWGNTLWNTRFQGELS